MVPWVAPAALDLYGIGGIAIFPLSTPEKVPISAPVPLRRLSSVYQAFRLFLSLTQPECRE